MNITTTYTLTPDEALRGSRTFKGVWYAASVGLGLLLVVLGLAAFFLGQDQRELGPVMVVNGLLFAALPELILRLARRRRGQATYAPMEVLLEDAGLTLRTESTEGSLPWEAFTKIQRRSGFWIFRLTPSQAVLLPERTLDHAATAELETFLRARNLMKP